MNDHKLVRYALKVILTVLIEKKSVNVYYFNQKYRISPNVIVSCILYLENESLASYHDDSSLILKKLSVDKQALVNYLLKNNHPDLSKEIDIK